MRHAGFCKFSALLIASSTACTGQSCPVLDARGRCGVRAEPRAVADRGVPDDQGVVMGRVQIFAEQREVTRDCKVGLSGEGLRDVRIKPDVAGWIFVSVPKGEARISSVDCGAKSYVSGLEFDVPGEGRTTYFGHVRLDLHPETQRVPSSNVEQGIANGMRSVPPTITGAAVGSAVGVVALLLLSDTVAVGRPIVEVEDKTYEAVAAYQARYGRPPKALVVSLAGSSFSSDPSISPSVQKNGDVIFTEARIAGIQLTWLAVSNREQHNAALRAQRFARSDAACPSMKLVLDGQERVVPTVSKTEHASAVFKQTVQGEMDLQTIEDVARAKHVVVDVCGTVRVFSALAHGATINFANAYRELAARLAAQPAATPLVAGQAMAAPAATQADAAAATGAEPARRDPEVHGTH
jgi:hypothetical protein